MNLSWWADVAGLVSFALSIPAYWAALSEKGRAAVSSRRWIFFLLFSLAITVAGLHLLVLLGVVGRSSPDSGEGISFATTELKQVRNRHYMSETVPLDGFEYVECTFDNVTFEYYGRAPFRITGGAIRGQSRLNPKNQAILATMEFLESLGALQEVMSLHWKPEKNIQERLP